MRFFSVTAKLGNMRKAVSWSIYPESADSETVKIQSDTRMAEINRSTGLATLSKSRSGGAVFMDLMTIRGATVVPVSRELIEEIWGKLRGQNELSEAQGLASNQVSLFSLLG